MLKQPRRTALVNGVKILLGCELICFFGSYFVWNRMNSSREFRYRMLNTLPSVLEGYYLLGETLDKTNNTRCLDQAVWSEEGRSDAS